ncbi:uncharacterized protein LODBEIA_P49340 [Lodderomyces beijingensis]|uniref:2-(3-amino-3-carboxypropyl)histidine synthase subunit 2 n=1 Tax=Lodderomyces beijingensis TaxID=1775926 RepID=A0ABP0ZVY6_9ASCO
MPSEEKVAPVLSTYQDDSSFSYSKVQSTRKERRHLDLQDADDLEEVAARIRQYYSLDQLVEKLQETNDDGLMKYKRITLQFPDSLICDSATVVHHLQKKLNPAGANNHTQKIWILADTSYSECCIDEVAAEHVNSDLVVHFGEACLNEVAKLEAIYVLGKPKVDVDRVVEELKGKFGVEEKVVLMADAPHTYILGELKSRLPEYENLTVADLTSSSKIIDYQQTPSIHTHFNRALSIKDTTQAQLFHITVPHPPRLLQLTTSFASVTLFDPASNCISNGPFPNLMRRYRYVYKAKSAGTIGILVNTLSLSNTKLLINTIKEAIKAAGKKHYTFVVGKPNVAKLANFESIDVWCILGCDHSGIILDEVNEFFKPIVTPFELLLGLSDEVTWTGKWVTDYNSVIAEYENATHESNDSNRSSDDEPEFDPVTGKYVSTSRPLRQVDHLAIKNDETPQNSELVQRFSNTVSIRNTVSTSAIHLQNRHWTGLGSDYYKDDTEEGAAVEEGRAGIARGYGEKTN